MASPESKRKALNVPQAPISRMIDDFDLPSENSLDDGVVDAMITQLPTPKYTGSKLSQVANGEAFKVIVIGNASVGKTRMTYLFVNNELPPVNKQESLAVEFYGKTIVFGMTD